MNVPGLLDDIPVAATLEQLQDEKVVLAPDLNHTLKASIIAFRVNSFKPNVRQLPVLFY